MVLNGKQRRHLRGVGQKLDASAHIGKAGLTESALAAIAAQLDQRELLKIRLTGAAGQLRHETAEQLAQALDAHVAGVVGRTVLLYRPNDALTAEHRIALP